MELYNFIVFYNFIIADKYIMGHRLFFTYNNPANVNVHYVVGAGVGSKSRSVRSALKRKASNNAQGKPCCIK